VRLALTEDEAALHAVIGTEVFLRARGHLDREDFVDLRWRPGAGQIEGRLRGAASGLVTATVTTDAAGEIARIDGSCTCGDPSACAHPAALVLLARGSLPGGTISAATAPSVDSARAEKAGRGAASATAAARPSWETALARIVDRMASAPDGRVPDNASLGLQFDLIEAASAPKAAGKREVVRPWRVGLHPVVPGRTGWVRSGISWSSLQYSRYGHGAAGERQRRLLNEIPMLSMAGGDGQYYGYHQQKMFLDAFGSRRIWDLLAEAEEIGLPLVQAGKAARPVVVSPRPARISVQVERVGDDLLLVPILLVDGLPIAPDRSLLVGRPAHGVVWWGERTGPAPSPNDRVLRLAALEAPLAPETESALTGPPIQIPVGDENRFFREYYPGLLRQVEVVAADDSVRLPDLGPATLTLTIDRLPRHELALEWQWVQQVGDQRHIEQLYTPPPTGHADQREALTRRVTVLLADHHSALLEPSPRGLRLAETARVSGDAVIHVLNEVLPRLAELDGVDVVTRSSPVDVEYREVSEPPEISFADTGSVAESDWFDLAVRINVGGEDVAFDELFIALAQDRKYLILPSGAYFSLDRAEFWQLRELIAEARALQDAPSGVLRVGRFQAGLWQELAELGEITGQARAWQKSVQALAETGDTLDRPVPTGLRATLRPYQRDGFGWLAALYDHGLGGILADDMGLGKTLQTLALICRAGERGGSTAPFLVVAPASVVHNWVAESARFTPDLTVRAITQTRSRRGVELAEAVTGADVVITSYTLFRLEYDDYEALKWVGLVLDEAQFIKNPHARVRSCAKRLPAPFKLAITGTPMENNLTELWSLCDVTAPGLFPRLDRFTDYYRNPIERNHDVDRLAQLRRRIKPLMLRRGKAEVATDLPEKQEQVIELELDRKQRKVYQTYLHRERQKVLGLLGEFEQHRFEIFRSLMLLRQASLDVALVDPKHRDVPSTKLEVLTEQVANLVAEGHRSLIFSQFTRFLGAARERLESIGIRCCYLDGSTRKRAAVLAEFKNGTAPVFLISLKAGGFGLNLTEADYCFLLDPWWNPATEAQAVDRLHRIGQTRNVMVYRLVAKDTIEEKVMALKARKAELFGSVLDGGDFASAEFTASDIQALLE
jgi:superfamily II DNA or RNA helicase